jgi:hypothetical protein
MPWDKSSPLCLVSLSADIDMMQETDSYLNPIQKFLAFAMEDHNK